MRRSKRKLLVGGALAALNIAVCVAFYISRPADEAFFRRWGDADRGAVWVVSDADPMHFAERPVYKAPFHGTEAWWVRLHLLASAPSFVFAFAVEQAAVPGPWIGSLGLERYLRIRSWVLGLSYLLASTAQWFLVGFIASVIADRLRSRRGVAA